MAFTGGIGKDRELRLTAIKAIEIDKLAEDDLSELLRIFMVTENPLTRDHLASVFSDLHYDKAGPYIIKKAEEKDVIGNNKRATS